MACATAADARDRISLGGHAPTARYRSRRSLLSGERPIKPEEEATMASTHKGECFCGAVHVEVSGEPEAMGYCHCRSCRSWSGGPVNAFTLWKPAAVRVTAGAEHVAMFQK